MPDFQTASLENRLLDAFSAVFPTRSREEILSANRDGWPEWDSLAAITLLTVLQQEFHSGIELADLETLPSFAAVRDYVKARANAV